MLFRTFILLPIATVLIGCVNTSSSEVQTSLAKVSPDNSLQSNNLKAQSHERDNYETKIAKALNKTKGNLQASFKYDNSFSLEVNNLPRYSAIKPQPYTFDKEFSKICKEEGGNVYKCDFSGDQFSSTSEDYLCSIGSNGEEYDLSEFSFYKPSNILTIDPVLNSYHDAFYSIQFISEAHGVNIHKKLAELMGDDIKTQEQYVPATPTTLSPTRYDPDACKVVWVSEGGSISVLGE
ncbi:hypothetical protein N9W89_08670 [Hellea sp.]|nr:hypothetical protein [Hellea sp.]